jgi:hypothetical protein
MSASDTSFIRYDPQAEALASGQLLIPGLNGISTKSSVILIRWPVVLISASLILFRARTLPIGTLFDALIVFYALSNAALYFVDESAFRKLHFNVLLIGLDTFVLTASLMVNGHTETNFFLAYFLLIIICCIFENPRMIAIVSFVAPFAYAGFFFDASDHRLQAICSWSSFSLSASFTAISPSWCVFTKLSASARSSAARPKPSC